MRASAAGFALGECLRERAGEIEAALGARLRAIADPTEVADPAYALGLREAISAALEYSIEAIEGSGRTLPAVPLPLLAQARLAARSKVSLDIVLRRYFAGYTLLGDFVLEEAEERGVKAGDLKCRMRAQSAFFERVLGAVAREYEHEVSRRPGTREERRVATVRRLLAGEAVDSTDTGYDLELTHVGLIVEGMGGEALVRELAAGLGLRCLVVRGEPNAAWGWIGAARGDGPELAGVLPELEAQLPAGVAVACGEPARGLPGWRLTHRQAHAARPIAAGGQPGLARYADVALLAAALRDELLADSLRRLYLDPLRGERDGGEVARCTLEAYFSAGHQVSAAAAALGVSRQTVNARLRAVEERLGRPLTACAAELAIALRLESLYISQTR